jgi:hypothetical protein
MKKKNLFNLFVLLVLFLSGGIVNAQDTYPESGKMEPNMSEFWLPQPEIVTPGNIMTNSAPSDAIVLFDGKDLSAWVNSKDSRSAGWTVNNNGTFKVKKDVGDIQTKESFENFQLHIEWCIPKDIAGSSQSRGNSGIFLQNKYELQILDNYNNKTYSNGQAGSIYKQTRPLVNTMRPPGEWNVYDVIYTAPIFKDDGSYRMPPHITVLHNGVLIQNNTTILGTTTYIGFPKVVKHGAGPIRLQSHGDASKPISFRNIWIRKL